MTDFFQDKHIFFKYINTGVTDDFYVMVAGYERMDGDAGPKGPYYKTNFALHYCLKGKGTFTINNKTYDVGPGDVFLIPPNVVVKYIQDKEDPWTYIWYEFCGKSAYELLDRAGLTEKQPVYHTTTENICEPLLSTLTSLDEINEDLVCTGNIYLFLSKLIEERRAELQVVSSKHKVILTDIIKYIDNNFSNSWISLEEISNRFHLNKSYLTRIFKAKTNVTVSKYILMLRINKACELLHSPELSIKTVAYSVGFNDALYFSKKFKEVMGFPPTGFHSTHEL